MNPFTHVNIFKLSNTHHSNKKKSNIPQKLIKIKSTTANQEAHSIIKNISLKCERNCTTHKEEKLEIHYAQKSTFNPIANKHRRISNNFQIFYNGQPLNIKTMWQLMLKFDAHLYIPSTIEIGQSILKT